MEQLPEGQYRIHNAVWPTFEAKFSKLARRASKLGAGEVAYTILCEETYEVYQPDPMRFLPDEPPSNAYVKPGDEARYVGWWHVGSATFKVVTVSGDRPKLNGWKFVGTLQSLKDDEGKVINILRNVPGETIPAQYRDAEQWCDQCKARRYRIDTYIVQHEDGRAAQVGSDCLKDFLGHVSPEHIAKFAEYLIEAEALMGGDGGAGGGSGEGALYLPWVLTLTAARVRVKGWMSCSKAREINGEANAYEERVEAGGATGSLRRVEATADAVSFYLEKDKGVRAMARDGVEVTDADKAEAEAALDWVRSHDRADVLAKADGGSDYLWNLYAACARSDMSFRTLGIVASLIAAYQREMGRQAERKERNAKFANSQFIGTLKKREVFGLKLTADPVHYANDFGGSWLYRLEDEAGNQVTWWASSTLRVETGESEERDVWSPAAKVVVKESFPTTREWAVGETLTVKATVVKHEERNGIKTTTVNRLVIDVPKPAKTKKGKGA